MSSTRVSSNRGPVGVRNRIRQVMRPGGNVFGRALGTMDRLRSHAARLGQAWFGDYGERSSSTNIARYSQQQLSFRQRFSATRFIPSLLARHSFLRTWVASCSPIRCGRDRWVSSTRSKWVSAIEPLSALNPRPGGCPQSNLGPVDVRNRISPIEPPNRTFHLNSPVGVPNRTPPPPGGCPQSNLPSRWVSPIEPLRRLSPR